MAHLTQDERFTIYEMKIFNIQGELILQKTVNNNKQLEINLNGKSKGNLHNSTYKSTGQS